MASMVSDYLDYRKDNHERVTVGYIRQQCEEYNHSLNKYEAYDENNQIACRVCDITFADGSLLHLEFDKTGRTMQVNSPY